jgi:kynurenine formamidase
VIFTTLGYFRHCTKRFTPLSGRLLMRIAGYLFTLLSVSFCASADEQIDFGQFNLVDLSHSFDRDTIYWPTSPSGFELERLSSGISAGGYYYSANSFSAPEHGGTHIDAPVHFSEQGLSLDEIPVDRFLGPAIVIDVSDKTRADQDYLLTISDVEQFERVHGRIEAGTMVLMRTDHSRYWPDAAKYLGSNRQGDASNLHFPGYGGAAARLLVEDRQVSAIGIDTASIDHGPSRNFIVHQIVGRHNVLGFENLTHLDRLSPVGTTLIALPMKIGGGSGGPVRVIALVPK